MTGTTSAILDWSRQYIPDMKSRNVAVRELILGRTAAPTGSRETFFLKHSPNGSVFLYVEPYKFSATSSLKLATSNQNVFQWAASTLSCVFPNGDTDASRKPFKFREVLAEYEYSQNAPYSYSDRELINFLPESIEYLNNTFGFSYTYTGTVSTFNPVYSSTSDKELISKALSIIVRRNFVGEQKRKGLGVSFRGPMHSIDTKAQLKHYLQETNNLEQQVRTKVTDDRLGGSSGGKIDVYDETVVTE